MFALQPICEETVSLLTALFMGTNGACVDLNGRTVIFALLAFLVALLVIQKLANRLVDGPSKLQRNEEHTPQLRSGQVATRFRRELR